jgi:GNAT superfamily N-acetyltransferase
MVARSWQRTAGAIAFPQRAGEEGTPMDTEIRPATPADAPFLAWVMQAAARSHLPKGLWDLAFPGDDEPRLAALAAIATTDEVHMCHWSRFRVLTVRGAPAAGLSAYENAQHGMARLTPAMLAACAKLGYTPEQLTAMGTGVAPFLTLGYPTPDGVWIVEWVATRPEYRSQGLINRLLHDIIELGRRERFTQAQIGHLLGNEPARSAYRKVGFEQVDEWRHPEFEQAFGTPGAARMQRDL